MFTLLFWRFGFRKTPFGLCPLWYFASPYFADKGLGMMEAQRCLAWCLASGLKAGTRRAGH